MANWTNPVDLTKWAPRGQVKFYREKAQFYRIFLEDIQRELNAPSGTPGESLMIIYSLVEKALRGGLEEETPQ